MFLIWTGQAFGSPRQGSASSPTWRAVARVATKMEGRKRGDHQVRRQTVTGRLAAGPIAVPSQVAERSGQGGRKRCKPAWFVRAVVEETTLDPWYLITDWPVEDAEGAVRGVRLSR